MTTNYASYSGAVLPISAKPTTTIWGSSTEKLTGGAAPVELYGSGYGNRMVAGTGDTTFAVNSLLDTVTGGPGVDTAIATVNFTLPTGVENLTLHGGWSNLVGAGNSSANIIIADRAKQTIIGAGGDDVLVSAGGDTFVFAPGSGRDAVYNFHGGAGGDILRIANYGFTSFTQIQSASSQVGSDVVIRLSSTDLIDLKNTSLSALTASNFQLQIDTSKLTLTFDDEFSSGLKLYDASGHSGVWQPYYAWAAPQSAAAHTNGNEREIYVDPTFAGSGATPLGLNPFSVTNGVLSISASPTPAAYKSLLWGHDYTSGVLTTAQTFSQKYGYFEMKAQLPQGQGLWPAFWLVPTDGKSELDVMETINNFNTVWNTAHWTDADGTKATQSIESVMPNLSSGFHTYGVLWTASSLTWYIDGASVASMPTPASMNSPMYILMNLAVGGSWPGDPNSGTHFPASMDIDYVRAYSLSAPPAAVEPTSVASSTSIAIGADTNDLVLTGSGDIYGLGNSLDNHLTGNDGANLLSGRSGNDTLDGGGGADTLLGGTGNDVFLVNNAAQSVVENINEGTDTVYASIDYILPANVENLFLTGSAQVGTGNALDNHLTGDALANTLYGLGGNDVLDGGPGADTMIGGLGDDTYLVDNAADVVIENAGEGVDTVISSVSLTLFASVENLTLTGGATWGIGNALDNHIIGNDLANVLSGRSGADRLEGGGGNDTLLGGVGDDTLTGGPGADTFGFTPGGGHDLVNDFGVGGHDVLDLSAYLKAGFQPMIADQASGVILSFSNGDTIQLLGAHPADLHVSSLGYTA